MNREVFGLNRIKSFANAIVMERMIEAIAKREGKSKKAIFKSIQFKKATEAEIKAELKQRKGKPLFQGKDGKKNFENWKDGAEEYYGPDIQDIRTGEKVVIKAYHGTTRLLSSVLSRTSSPRERRSGFTSCA